MGVGQDQNDDRDERDDLSHRQSIQEGGELHDKDFPQQIAERRWLIDSPLLAKLLKHPAHPFTGPEYSSARTAINKDPSPRWVGHERT